MLSNTQSKYIRSLTQQKYRKEYNQFIAEGDKIAKEWLATDSDIKIIAATKDWLDDNAKLVARHKKAEVITVTDAELERISALQTPNKALLVVAMPHPADVNDINGWTIALQQLQDPGNMGTIIRIADWFGIKNIICSPDSVDVYNPKAVQSAMGGHLRVNIHTAELEHFIGNTKLPVYAAMLNGDNIYDVQNPAPGIILIGNESKGLPEALSKLATNRVTIPRIGGAESLNAAVSTGIIVALLAGR